MLSKAKGKNLLYFGCRHEAKDFLYKDELSKFILWFPDNIGMCLAYDVLLLLQNNGSVREFWSYERHFQGIKDARFMFKI